MRIIFTRLIPIGLMVLFLSGFGIRYTEVPHEFITEGHSVSDGQITISIAEEALNAADKIEVIQEEQLLKHIAAHTGNWLVGFKMRPTMKVNFEIKDFRYTFGTRHSIANRTGLLKLNGVFILSENGVIGKTFKSRISAPTKRNRRDRYDKAGFELANAIRYYGRKLYRMEKKKK